MQVTSKLKRGDKMPRLTIRLPEGHPIWQLPSGERSAKIREYIDLGLSIGAKLDTIENKLNNLALSPKTEPEVINMTSNAVEFDTNAFQNL